MKHTILFLAANPNGTDPRALGREVHAIQVELKRSGFRDGFESVTRWAAEPLDLLRDLQWLKPTVVHFSGHGGQDGLFFRSVRGDVQAIPPAAIAQTFDAAGTSVKLVVLSACNSENLVQALLDHVDCVVGTSGSIGDEAARSFAVSFYGALSARESVAAAFRHGIAALHLKGLRDIEPPQLRVREMVDAERLILVDDAPEVPFRTRGFEASSPRSYLDLFLEGPKRFFGRLRNGRAAQAAAAPTIHLNVWFPEHQGSEVTLTVGVATRMWVNLAHGPRAGTLASERVSDDTAQRFYEVDHVDVVAISPGADVWPLRARLPLPPDADAVASFEITPRRAGQLELSVILLIEGESIHQTKASILASAPASATTEVPR